jgi:RNA polymerase sigma-70 factor (ECF subfamily)
MVPRLSPSTDPIAHTRMSDEELWLRFAQLDCETSLSVLHKRYHEPLLAWIRRCGVRDEARASDLVQDVWIRLVNNRDRFDPRMKWGTWVFHVAKNIAKNEARRLHRRIVTPEADFNIKDAEPAQFRAVLSPNRPDEMMRERQLSAKLEEVLASLSEEQRTLFTLRYIEGRPNEEVSQILGIPLVALQARAKRVRMKVLSEMQSILDDSP